MDTFDIPSVDEVNQLVGGHDPGRTLVRAEGEWLRVELARPNDDGIAQLLYLYRLGPIQPGPGGTPERAPKTRTELLAEVERNPAIEFRPADLTPVPKDGERGTAADTPAPKRRRSVADSVI